MGTGISILAIPWYFIHVIKESEVFGTLYAITTFALIFWGLYAGSLIDRYDRKKLFMVATGTASTLLLTVAAFGFYYGQLPTGIIGMVLVITFLFFNMHYPNIYALGQEMTEPKYFGRFNSLIEVQGQTISALAGGLAAILISGVTAGPSSFLGFTINVPFDIEAWSMHKIFLVDGITYAMAFTCISLLKYERIAERIIDVSPVIKQVKTGITYLKNNTMLFLFGMTSYMVFATILVSAFYLQAEYVERYLKAGGNVYAISDAAFALGAILAGLSIRWLFKKTGAVTSIIVLSILCSLAYFVYLFNTNHFIFYLMFMLVGLSNAGIRVQRMTWFFEKIPNSIIGRANSIFRILNALLRILLIAIFSLAFFKTGDNIKYAYLIMSILTMASGIVLWVYRKRFGED